MKNIANVETVDKNTHGKLRVKYSQDYVHAKEFNLVAVTIGEFGACASNFPLMFVPAENNQYRPVALLGLRPGENVYYGETGWDCTYMPLMFQRHPFVIGFDDRVDDDKTLATCLHTNSPMLNETDGIAMFTDSGEETDFLKSRHLMMRDIFESEKVTDEFMRKVQDLKLLSPVDVLVKPENGEPRRISGMFTISERKMKALTAEQIQDLHQKDFLLACYLILGSVFQLHNLMKLRNRKAEEKVTDYRIEIDPPPPPAAA